MLTQMFLDLLALIGIIILLGIGVVTVITVVIVVALMTSAARVALHEKKEDTKHE